MKSSNPSFDERNPVHLPLNIYLFIFIGIVVIVFVIVITQALSLKKKEQKNNEDKKEAEFIPEFPPAKVSAAKEGIESKIVFSEDIEIMRPWREGKTLLDFGIDGDLPLIWDTENVLSVSSPSSITIFSSDSEPRLFTGTEIGIILRGRCTGFLSSKEGFEDFKMVRSVDYQQESVDLFRLNFLYKTEGGSSLTPSEIINKVMESDPSSDKQALRSVLMHFEKSLYGKRRMSREEFQSYVRMLIKSRKDTLGFVCRRNINEQNP